MYNDASLDINVEHNNKLQPLLWSAPLKKFHSNLTHPKILL